MPRVIPDGVAVFSASPGESIPVADWKSPRSPVFDPPKTGFEPLSFPPWETWFPNQGYSTSLPALDPTAWKP